MKRYLSLIVFCLVITSGGQSQILDKIKKAKDKIAENTIDKLSRDPITTSFSDVHKTKYIENTVGNDEEFQSIFAQPFEATNGYALQPGYYEGTFQSFCIKAGTYNPTGGQGRFYAPIKGPKADIMTAIIEHYQQDPTLTQREVQLLLWAIIAKTDFSKMKGPVKATALKILTPAQIGRLSKGAIDKLTRSELRNVANQSPAIRAILQAEDQLRRKYYSGARTYKDYEDIAIRAGVEPIVPGWEAGRWTKHPDGYFIRYFPKGYARTTTQVYVPENFGGPASFNPGNDVAVPAGRGQRLLQTNLPYEPGGPNTGGNDGPANDPSDGPTDDPSSTSTNDPSTGTTVGILNDVPDPFCDPVVNPIADKAVIDEMIMQNIPGLAVAIFQNGEIIHLKAYGYLDIYNKIPVRLDSRMKWASISKSVTGVAAAQLEERGYTYKGEEFKVGKKIINFVENWNTVKQEDTAGIVEVTDPRPREITLAHTLTNYSGIQQYGQGSRPGEHKYYTMIKSGTNKFYYKFKHNQDAYYEGNQAPWRFNGRAAVEVFNKSVLDTIPGKKYLYSSYGFTLAGAAIDNVAPDGYTKWVRDNIIRKADLRTMQVGRYDKLGHAMDEDGLLVANKSEYNPGVIPAGGYESNICDLAKYARALSTGEFFEKESNKEILWDNSITRMTKPDKDTTFLYSYGLNFRGTKPDLRVWHGGKHANVRSYIHFLPSDTTGIAIIAPAVYANLPRMTNYIFQELGIRSFYMQTKTPRDYCEENMESVEDLFYGVWRKTGKDVLVRTGLESRGFFDHMEFLKENGYEVIDVESYEDSGKQYWDAVLRKGSPDTKLVSDLTLDQLKQRIADMKNNGYIPVDIESYIRRFSGRFWGAVFMKIDQQSKVTFKKRGQELLATHQANKANGLKLVDIEAYQEGNIIHWTGVWKSGGDTILELNITPDQFFERLDSKRNQGYGIADLEYYQLKNKEWRVGVVWERSTLPEFITGEIFDADGDGKDDDGNTKKMQEFCDHMNTHHEDMKDYRLIDWERVSRNPPGMFNQ